LAFVKLSVSAYYLPIDSLTIPLVKTKKSTFCEWKGWATYYSMNLNGQEVKDRIWSYEDPTPRFKDLKGFVSFYVSPWGEFPRLISGFWDEWNETD